MGNLKAHLDERVEEYVAGWSSSLSVLLIHLSDGKPHWKPLSA